MRKFGGKGYGETLPDVGETDAYPLGAAVDVQKGYAYFCARHRGFDDDALARARRRARTAKKQAMKHGKG